ncbi:MAG TPA: tetratricopeptide repeat protein [Ignavibacteria bacterium]|jgi:TolB-like protein/Flp pilus assembly protein TadD
MTENIRLLAAIMFADMVGFTALMQEDEGKAKSKRDIYRKKLDKEITTYQGKILQYYGDGTLAIFGSAISAINCAVEVQKELQKEPKVPLRIGLHIGDIAYDDDGVFGDAVNIASRIESLAVQGSVLISEKLFDEIKNHPLLPARPMGHFELKNVKQPVSIYAMTNEGLVVPKPDELHGKAKNAYRSLAVLPFLNMSPDPDNEFFSDGISEEIINALTKVEGLQVTSRTSSFAFKGKNDDIRQIAQKLNVSTILEGSVRKAGERVRITAQLVNAVDGYHFWSESYDGQLENIFDLQDEISRKIANKLIEHLAVGKVTAPLVKSSTTNLEAYNHYLRGIYYWNKWNPADNPRAIQELQKAIEIEPNFGRAYAWLANCYVLAGSMGFLKPEIAFPKAKEYGNKAIMLDPESPECNIAIGLIDLFVNWNWEGARKAFEKAIELNPGVAGAHQTYGLYLIAVGKNKEALESAETAARLDPLSLPIGTHLAQCYFSQGRFDDAIRQLNKVLELDPAFRNAIEFKAWAYYLKGECDTAISLLKQYQKLAGNEQKGWTSLAYAYSRCGFTDKTREILKILERRINDEPGISLSIDFAIIYTGLKEYDKALDYLDKAVNEHSGAILFLRINPLWKDLEDFPRFKEILKRIGFE